MRGYAASPLVTSGGDVFTITGERYKWKPAGAPWTSRARPVGSSNDVDFMSSVVTGRHEVTVVWAEEVAGEMVQYFSRSFDANGRRGRTRPILDPTLDSGPYVDVARSMHGVIAVVVASYDTEHHVNRVLVRDSAGTWRDGQLPQVPDLVVQGASVEDDGSVTLVGYQASGEFPIVALTSVAGGPWAVQQIGPREGQSAGTGNVPMEVAADRHGGLVVAWGEHDVGFDRRLVVATRGPNVTDTWALVVLDERLDCWPRTCWRARIDDDGNAAVLWARPHEEGDESHNPPMDVRLARYDAAQAEWTTPQTLIESTHNAFTSISYSNYLSVAPTGDVLVDYEDPYPHPDGRFTFTCSPNPQTACHQHGYLAGPLESQLDRVVSAALPGQGGVALWTPKCGSDCRPQKVRSQFLEPHS